MYIDKQKRKPKRITSRPATLARLKKSCWIKPAELSPAICRPVVLRVARTGGVRRPIEQCMYHPPTQKALRYVRGTLFDGLCMGQPPDQFLNRKPNGALLRGRKRRRSRKDEEEDQYVDEGPPTKRKRQVRSARPPQPRMIVKSLPKVPGTVPKAKPPGPGYCHNCKKARDSCIVCPNVRTHRFCTNCVARHFADDYDIYFNKGVDCWEERDGCPVCFWQCPCAACKRRMTNRKLKASKTKGRAESAQIPDAGEEKAEAGEEEEEEETEERTQPTTKISFVYEPAGFEEIGEKEADVAWDDEFAEDQESDEEDDDDEESPNDEDNGEGNIEGHTHSEEDLQERESRKSTKKKRRFGRIKRRSPIEEDSVVWSEQDIETQMKDAVEQAEDEEEEEEEEDNSRNIFWTPIRIMARRQRSSGEKEYFVMWKDRWLTGDDTVSMYRRGELKEILKKRKRKRHPIEYLVKRKFSWEKEERVPQKLLDLWGSTFQRMLLLQERGKGKGKGEGWEALWQNEIQRRKAPTTIDIIDSE